MRFEPKTEEELNAGNLMANGEYDFEVADAEEQTSKKSGNDMIKLKLNFDGDEGRRHVVFDYLVGSEASLYKVRGFAEAVGLLPQYESGELQAVMMNGRTGRAKVEIDHKDKAYPAKNVIRNYIKPKNGAAPATKGNHHAVVDDEIPFAPEWR